MPVTKDNISKLQPLNEFRSKKDNHPVSALDIKWQIEGLHRRIYYAMNPMDSPELCIRGVKTVHERVFCIGDVVSNDCNEQGVVIGYGIKTLIVRTDNGVRSWPLDVADIVRHDPEVWQGPAAFECKSACAIRELGELLDALEFMQIHSGVLPEVAAKAKGWMAELEPMVEAACAEVWPQSKASG